MRVNLSLRVGEGLHLRGWPGNEVNMVSKREGDSILHGRGGKVASLSTWGTKAKDDGWRVVGR